MEGCNVDHIAASGMVTSGPVAMVRLLCYGKLAVMMQGGLWDVGSTNMLRVVRRIRGALESGCA